MSITGRAEYFSDKNKILLAPITSADHFAVFGASMGVNIKPASNILIRLEARTFYSGNAVFEKNAYEVKTSSTITSGVTLWF